MIFIAQLLLTLAIILLSAYIIISVFILALEKQPEIQQDTLYQTIQNVVYQSYIIIVSVGSAFLNAGSTFASHALAFYPAYITVGLFVFAAQMNTQYHSEILSSYDHGNTKYFLPVYSSDIMPVANFGRVLGDATVCWSNLFSSRNRVIIASSYTVLSNCVESNWQLTANNFATFVLSPFQSLLDYIQRNFASPFDFYTIFASAGRTIASFQPMLNCACQDLSFFWNITLLSVNDTTLHLGLNATANAALDVVSIPASVLIGIFQSGFYACNETTPEQQIICLSQRPPNLTPLQDDLDDALIFLMDWVDHVLMITFDQFFDFTHFTLPKIGPLVSRPLCVLVDVTINFLDILFHIDLVFGPSSGPKVNYLQFVDLTKPFNHAYEFNTLGIYQFFGAMDLDIAQKFGCVIALTLNVTIRSIQFGTQTFVIWTTNSTAVNPYIANYDKNIFIQELLNISTCTDELLADIDVPLGQIFKYIIQAITQTIITFINLFEHINNDFENYLQGPFSTDIDMIFANLTSVTIGLGNFFRQLSLPSSPGSCPLKDPTNFLTPYPTQVDIFCCFGNAIEAALRFVISLIQLVKDSVVGFVTHTPKYVFDNIFHPETTFIPQWEQLVSDAACILAYFFPSSSCPSGTGTTPQQEFRDLFTSVFNVTTAPMNIIKIMADVIRASLDGGSDVSSIVCNVLIGGYDVGPGNGFNVLRAASNAGACLVNDVASQNISAIGQDFWTFFGWDDATTSLRFVLCEIANVIVGIVQFLSNFFRDPAGTIFNEIQGLINEFVTVITAGIQQALNTLTMRFNNLVGQLQSIFTSLGSILSNLFGQMFNCVISCIELDCSQTECDFSNINIPNVNVKRRTVDIYATEFTISYNQHKRSVLDDYSVSTKIDPRDYVPAVVDPYYDTIDEIPFWTNDTIPCRLQYDLLASGTLDNATKHLMAIDFKKCMMSSAIARSIDLVLQNIKPDSDPLIDPLFLYDPTVGASVVKNVTHGVSEYVGYLFDTEYNGTWTDYAFGVGVTDPLSVRIGVMLSFFGDVAYYSENGSPLIKNLVKIGKIIYKYGFQIWTSGSLNIIDRLQAIAHANFSEGVFMVGRHIVSHPQLPEIRERTLEVFPNWPEKVSAYLHERSQTNDPRHISNRFSLVRIMNKITNIAAKTKAKYFGETIHNTPPPQVIQYESVWGPYKTDDVKSFARNVDTPNDPLVNDVSNLDPFCSESSSTVCINCQLLEDVVEGYIDGIFACIEKYDNGIIVDMNQFLQNTPIYPTGPVFSQATIFLNATSPVRSNAITRITSSQTSDNSGSINTAIISAVQWVVNLFSGVGNLTNILIQEPANFLTNVNPTDRNSWLFWADFMVICRFEQMGNCSSISPKGLGLPTALTVTIYAYLIIALITLVFSPASYIIAVLISITVPLFFGVGYLTSPLCLIPSPLPTLPDCIFDDSLIFMNRFNKPCLDWASVLPGLTPTTCPTSAQDFTRPFVHCNQPPYNFIDGLRNLFYVIQVNSPSTITFIKDTTIPAISWITTVPYFEDRINFDFGPSGVPNDTWSSCNLLTSPNWIPAGFLVLESGILLFIFTSPVVLLIGAALALGSMILIIIMQLIASISGIDFSRNLYFVSKRELTKPTVNDYESSKTHTPAFPQFQPKPKPQSTLTKRSARTKMKDELEPKAISADSLQVAHPKQYSILHRIFPGLADNADRNGILRPRYVKTNKITGKTTISTSSDKTQ